MKIEENQIFINVLKIGFVLIDSYFKRRSILTLGTYILQLLELIIIFSFFPVGRDL